MNKKVLIAGILFMILIMNFIGSTVYAAVTTIDTKLEENEKQSAEELEDQEESQAETTEVDSQEESEIETTEVDSQKESEEEKLEEDTQEENQEKITEEGSKKETEEVTDKQVESQQEITEVEKQDEKKEENKAIANTAIANTANTEVGVTYQGHGEDYGWQGWVSNGELAGTTGECRRLEGIKIELKDAPKGAQIVYRVHGQDYGWQSWVSDGSLAGTVGESRRIEGIEIKLMNMDGYSVQYRAHGEDYGWQNWVSDGELAGTTGISKRMEGLEIRIVKNETAQEPEEPEKKELTLTYRGQGEDYGWQNWVSEGQLAGTDGQSKRLEGIEIKLVNAPEDAKILYQAHGEDYGWQSYVSDGSLAGTDGESRRMEGIRIQLVNLDEYSVQYRAQVEDFGWMEWVSDGELAGTTGESRRLEGLEIRIVPKIKHSKVEIETPTRTILTSSDLEISGYALSEYENTVLKLYVDSNLISTTRTQREDVFSNYITTSTTIKVNYGDSTVNPTPGYTAKVDLSAYKDGKHTILVRLYDEKESTILASATKEFAYYSDRTYGIDVSKYQGSINWTQVKQSNVDFAMIRIGLRGYETGKIVEDNYYKTNVQEALKNGIKCGVYFFSQAINREEGIEEANWVLENIKGYDITYPIAIDTEWSNSDRDGRADNISVKDRTEAMKGFVETIQKAGYTPIIYASKDWLINQLNMSELTGYDVWLAHYVSGAPENTSDYTGYYTIWQYSSTGSINGINGNVDLDISYKKYEGE